MQIVGEKVEPLPVPGWKLDCNFSQYSQDLAISHIGFWVEKCLQRYTFTAWSFDHDACDYFSVDQQEDF